MAGPWEDFAGAAVAPSAPSVAAGPWAEYGVPSSAPAQQPGFWQSLVNALPNPKEILKEWSGRPREMAAAMDAAHVAIKIRKEKREPTPQEQAILERGISARIQNPEGNLLSEMAGPGMIAWQQAAEGNIAGAAGTLAGGYAVPAAVGGVLANAAPIARAAGRGAGAALRAATAPGVPEMISGAGEAMAGMGAATAGHPIVGGGLIIRGASRAAKGYGIRQAARAATAETEAAAETVPRGTPPTPTPVAAAAPQAAEPVPRADTLKPGAEFPDGTQRVNSQGGIETLQTVPLDQVASTPGNKVHRDVVERYKAKPTTVAPELRVKPEGGYEFYEGHHRIKAVEELGQPTIKAWVSESGPNGFPKVPEPAIAGAGKPAAQPAAPAAAEPQPAAADEPRPAASPPPPAVSPAEELAERLTGRKPAGPTEPVVIPAPEAEFAKETYEAAAHAKKNPALANFLNEKGISYDLAKLMKDEEWAQVAQVAGENMPSKASKAEVLFYLKKLDRATAPSE